MNVDHAAVLDALNLAAWQRGRLRHLLHEDQQGVYDHFYQTAKGRYVMEISRRWGKTFLLCVLAIEACLRKHKSRVVFGAPTLKHAQEFIQPVMDSILESCPPDLRPAFSTVTGHYDFPNGSHIVLFGADDKRKADRGRGPAAVLAIFDEAGFCGILQYVVRSVLRPQLLHSNGRMILGSTPAELPEHDFSEMAENAEVSGNYARRTIFDNSRLTQEQIKQFIEDDAKDEGLTPEEYMETTDFQREYLAKRIVDKTLLVIPEAEKALEHCVYEVNRPEYFDAYTTLDFGGIDPHAATFGYFHFDLAKIVIEDELLLKNGETTEQLSDAIKEKERDLWGSDCWAGTLRGARDSTYTQLLEALPTWLQLAEIQTDSEVRSQPFARFSDNDVQLVRDLHTLHKISFVPTPKTDKQLQINALRVALNRGDIIIHPRCVNLIRQLRTATWSSNKRNDYRRIAGEHADLVDTVVYKLRNIYRRNPYPATYGQPTRISAAQALKDRQKKLTMIGNSPLARRIAGRT